MFFLVINVSLSLAQCASLFSFAANFETVNFYNQSNIPNSHYFWNFGDGTGSNFKDPIHKFPETGSYFVTLFSKDTVSGCSSFYEYWVNVVKFSTDTCQPASITDSVFIYNNSGKLQLVDNSINCNNYLKLLDGGGSQNFQPIWWLNLGPFPGRYFGRIRYAKFDTAVNDYTTRRAVYKSSSFRYTSAKNYGDCSANFEFKVVSQNASGQRILFTAMNKAATSYEWRVVGFGNPIYSYSDTVSQVYPYTDLLWRVILRTTGANGCIDSLSQNIVTQTPGQTITGINKYSADKLSLNIYPNPAQDKFVVSTDAELDKLTLVNCVGQEIFVLSKPQLKQEIDISRLPTGIYFLKAENRHGQAVFKFIKD